jgi:mitochondrial import inner membrane translocase subunit TIM22
MNGSNFPGLVPLFPSGKEPLPPGVSEDERDAFNQMKKTENFMTMASESCAFKTVLAGGGG